MEDEELKFGPNGGLVFAMEFLLENQEWLEEALGEGEDDYIIFDCPGQIELYTHMPVMRRLVDTLQAWNFRICGIFVLDCHFMVDGNKFISGAMAALSVMVNLELPHVNVLSKVTKMLEWNSFDLKYFRWICSRRVVDSNWITFWSRILQSLPTLASPARVAGQRKTNGICAFSCVMIYVEGGEKSMPSCLQLWAGCLMITALSNSFLLTSPMRKMWLIF